jgi:hypothetical protein
MRTEQKKELTSVTQNKLGIADIFAGNIQSG